MSGVLSVAASAPQNTFMVVADSAPFGGIGFYLGSTDALAPVGSYRGRTIENIFAPGGASRDFVLTLQTAGLSQSFIRSVYVQDSTGSIRQYSTSNAEFANENVTQWSWGDGLNRVWTSADSVSRRVVIF